MLMESNGKVEGHKEEGGRREGGTYLVRQTDRRQWEGSSLRVRIECPQIKSVSVRRMFTKRMEIRPVYLLCKYRLQVVVVMLEKWK